jgi:isopentenyl-diphosphate Delta-isomerase
MADELLDIVNDEDVIIDQQMRSVAHQLGLQHRGVHVFLFTSDGKMLVQKRSKDRAQYSSALDCSVSEHVKAGEGYLETAIRGMKEEMGVEGIEVKPLVKFRMEYGPNDNEISTLFEGVVDPAKVKFDPIEIEEINYYTLNELQQMVNEGEFTVCGWFVELLNWYAGKSCQFTVLKTEK